MRVCLVGHKGSHLIIPTSSWLWKKYSPASLQVEYLNFGKYDGKLFRAKYVELAEDQVGGVKKWAKYIYDYVNSITDLRVILGCDDFLLNAPVDIRRYKELLRLMYDGVPSARLGDVSWYPSSQYDADDRGIVRLKDHADYMCTGQLTIWDRKVLLQLLDRASDIWDFESGGSVMMKRNGWGTVASYDPPFKYHTISALSGQDKKIDLTGLNEEDKKYIIDNLITDGEIK